MTAREHVLLLRTNDDGTASVRCTCGWLGMVAREATALESTTAAQQAWEAHANA